MKKAMTRQVAVMSTALMLMGCCKMENACVEAGNFQIPEQIPRCSTKPQFWNDSCDDLAGR